MIMNREEKRDKLEDMFIKEHDKFAFLDPKKLNPKYIEWLEDKVLEGQILPLVDVMPSVLWKVAKKIKETLKHCHENKLEPMDSVLWDIVEEDWYDYLKEEIFGEED